MKKTKAFVKLRRLFFKRLCLCWMPTLNSTKKNTNLEMYTEKEKIDIEKEYMPHEWSTKFQTPEEVLKEYINFITTESEKATDSIPNKINVKYGNCTGRKLDIFGTDLPDDSPILVYIHGCYWKQVSKETSRFPAVSLHKAGVKTFLVEYDQHRQVTLWDTVKQVEEAIFYVLEYAEERNSRGVYLAGHSGGAQLIANVMANSQLFSHHAIQRLNGVFLISGLYDLRTFFLTSANGEVNISKIDAMSMSPIFNNYTHLEDSSIRFYILAAEEDSPTYKSQAINFYHLLFETCLMENMYLEIKDNMDHFDIVKCLITNNNYLKRLILHDLLKLS